MASSSRTHASMDCTTSEDAGTNHSRPSTAPPPLPLRPTLAPFVAGPRPLAASDALFSSSDAARERLAAATWASSAARGGPASAPAARAARIEATEAPRHACRVCGVRLATPFLLDLHLAEAHDSFFAAQAARGRAEFRCVLEGCGFVAASVEGREAHLESAHGIDGAWGVGRAHLGRRQGKPGGGRRGGTRGARGRGGESLGSEIASFGVSSSPMDQGTLAAQFGRLRFAQADEDMPALVSFGRRAKRGVVRRQGSAA